MSELKYNRILGKQVTGTPTELDQLVQRSGAFSPLQVQPTNQGVEQILVNYSPAGTDSTTSTSFVDINAAATSTFVAPYDGDYIFEMSGSWFITVVAVTGAFFAVSVGGTDYNDGSWHTTINEGSSHNSFGPFAIKVTLTRGTYTVKPRWRRDPAQGAGTLNTNTGDSIRVRVSQPGGTASSFYAQPIAAGPASVTRTTAQNTLTAIAGISGAVTIPATGTYLVEMTATFYATTGTFGSANYGLTVGATTVTFPNAVYAPLGGAARGTFACKQLVSLPAGTHTVTPTWRNRNEGGGTIQADGQDTIFVTISGGSAVNANLDTRGDSITYDAAAVPPVLAVNTFTYLVGYAGQPGSLRSLSVGMDGATVTAGTITCDLLIAGSVVSTAVLSTTDATFKVNDTTIPAITTGQKIELRFTTTATYQNSTAAAVGVQAVASFSTSTATVKAWHQSAYTGSVGSPSSTTWVGVAALITLADEVTTTDITRSTDSLTFLKGGIYQVDFSLDYANPNGHIGIRLRKTNGTPATLANKQHFSPSTPSQIHLNCLITVVGGDVVQVQYASAGGTPASWAGASGGISSEFVAISRLRVVRIS